MDGGCKPRDAHAKVHACICHPTCLYPENGRTSVSFTDSRYTCIGEKSGMIMAFVPEFRG